MSVPKLRFKEFDGDWKIKKLGNSFNLISGYAFPSSASVDKGAKWLKIADVGIQEMTPSSLSYLPHEFLEKYPQFIVSKDDYVIALTRPILNKKFSVHDKFHRTLILSGFCFLKIAKISLNSSFFPKPIKC